MFSILRCEHVDLFIFRWKNKHGGTSFFSLVFCIVVASKVNKFNSSDSLKYMVKC